jgi:hypothetical protein
MTGAAEEVPETTYLRAACMFLVFSLDGDALKSAFESLSDAYDWQKSLTSPAKPALVPRVVAWSPAIHRVERAPITIED